MVKDLRIYKDSVSLTALQVTSKLRCNKKPPSQSCHCNALPGVYRIHPNNLPRIPCLIRNRHHLWSPRWGAALLRPRSLLNQIMFSRPAAHIGDNSDPFPDACPLLNRIELETWSWWLRRRCRQGEGDKYSNVWGLSWGYAGWSSIYVQGA